jgi:hypothetical protein
MAQSTSELVWVAFDDPVDGPPIGSVDASDPLSATIPNWVCDIFDQCPEGAAKITYAGNYAGCTASCTGSCTRCSGSDENCTLCVKTPDGECDTVMSLILCGTEGTGICFIAPGIGEGDNNGCGCSSPPYYGTYNCWLTNCLYLGS